MQFRHLPVLNLGDATANFEQIQSEGAGGGTTIFQSTASTGSTGSFVPLTEIVEAKNVEGNVTLASPLAVQIFLLTIKTETPKIKMELAAGQSIQVFPKQDGSGARKPTFELVGGEIRWNEGAVYEATATAEAEDWLTFICSRTGVCNAAINALDMK